PIIAYFINAEDYMGGSSSSAGTLLMPAPTLGTEYVVATLPGVDIPPMTPPWNLNQSTPGRGMIEVIGTEDATMVTVRATGVVLQQWSSRADVPPPRCGAADDRSARWRVFAGEDGITVTITAGTAGPITFVPAPPFALAKKGDWLEFKSTGAAADRPGDFFV